METHQIHPELLKHRVRILVVGCGGNGSAIAAGLPYLHQALVAYGHPEGLHVILLDPDVISPTNCVRRPFSRDYFVTGRCLITEHLKISCIGGVQALRVDPKCWQRLRGKSRVRENIDPTKVRQASYAD